MLKNMPNNFSYEFKEFIESAINIIDTIGRTQTVWGVLFTIGLIAIFLYCIITFRKRINNHSFLQIMEFTKTRKYEKALYIELNRNMENLRFFINGEKWKHRLIKEYNNLFDGFEVKKMMNALGYEYKYCINRFSNISTIRKCLFQLNELFDGIRNDSDSYHSKFGDYFFIMCNQAYEYLKIIEQLLKTCDMIEKKNIILVGSAGNGKTNLMCRLSEVAIANKIPVLLINSRDIDEDCISYIYKHLPLSQKLKNLQNFYLKIISVLLLIQRKYFYIMLDAINENDKETFTKSIGKIADHFSKFSRIRIIYSCRSEYFESRFNNYFEHFNTELYVYNLMDSRYNDRATNRMFTLYSEYFGVKGSISPYSKKRLLMSLFLMRIFFEVNQGNNNTLNLQNSDIYLEYIERVSQQMVSFDFMDLVNNVAKKMLKKSDYSNLNFSELHLSNKDLRKIVHALDENIIISRTIKKGANITERTNEIIFFVFDELRDFCLARCLLVEDEENYDDNFTHFFDKTNELYTNRQSPIEGILKYGYYYFKKGKRYELAKRILMQYGESDIQGIVMDHHFKAKRNIEKFPESIFPDFGLSLILIDSDDIVDFEIAYIKEYIARFTNNYWIIFEHLLSNEYVNLCPRMNFALKILIEDRSYNDIIKILKYFFEDRYDYRHSYNDKKPRILKLCDFASYIQEKTGTLSIELKQFILLLCVIDPHEHSLHKYHKYAIDEMIFSPLIEMINEKKFEKEIKLLQKRVESTQQGILPSMLTMILEDELNDI